MRPAARQSIAKHFQAYQDTLGRMAEVLVQSLMDRPTLSDIGIASIAFRGRQGNY